MKDIKSKTEYQKTYKEKRVTKRGKRGKKKEPNQIPEKNKRYTRPPCTPRRNVARQTLFFVTLLISL